MDIFNNGLVIIFSAVIISAMVIVIAGIVILIEKGKTKKIKYSLSVITKQMETQNNYIANLELFQTKFKSIWHDFNNHIICIKHILNEGDYKSLSEYVSKLYDMKTKLNKPISTGNVIFDSIINEKKELATQSDIEFECNVKLPSVIYINHIDLCIILGNILDNALEACIGIAEKSPKRIEFIVGFKNDLLYISIKNSTDGKLKTKYNEFGFHGIGMKNIEDAVLRNNGNIVVEHTEHQFIVKIMLKNSYI